MFILIFILFNKIYTLKTSSLTSKLVRRFFPNIGYSLNSFIKKVSNLGTKYLIKLFVINAIIIVTYLFALVYINMELSNNLDYYIYKHIELKMKKSSILWLLSMSVLSSPLTTSKFNSIKAVEK